MSRVFQIVAMIAIFLWAGPLGRSVPSSVEMLKCTTVELETMDSYPPEVAFAVYY